jgi:hypothetical protein
VRCIAACACPIRLHNSVGLRRWDDLRSYIALDDQDITRAICITARWYNSGFPEDESGSVDHSFYVALPGRYHSTAHLLG